MPIGKSSVRRDHWGGKRVFMAWDYNVGNSKARIVMCCGRAPARHNATCDDWSRDMASRRCVGWQIFDRDQGHLRIRADARPAATKCRMDGAFATPNIALHISH
jgi:hypothetical protein